MYEAKNGLMQGVGGDALYGVGGYGGRLHKAC